MRPADRHHWILGYLRDSEPFVDVLNSDFVDAYLEATRASCYPMPYGAHKCPQLGRDLSTMHQQGRLARSRVGIDLAGMGFPKWVYVYRLAPDHNPSPLPRGDHAQKPPTPEPA